MLRVQPVATELQCESSIQCKLQFDRGAKAFVFTLNCHVLFELTEKLVLEMGYDPSTSDPCMFVSKCLESCWPSNSVTGRKENKTAKVKVL